MGGDSIYELGPLKDVVLFFDCLDYFVIRHHAEKNWSLLTDRLYRRYLRIEELDTARKLMEKVKEIFSKLASNEVNWRWDMQGDVNQTWLDARQPTLDIVFSKYFDNKAYGKYFAVRLSISNGIIFFLERDRPLEQYDNLTTTDEPFWLLSEEDFNNSLGHCT